MSKKNKINGVYLFLISLVSAFGGLLFGYDWVVIGGAKPFYEAYLGIENFPVLQGWAMSSALVGCILGVMTSGYYADRYGRKKLLILSAVLFIVSAVFTGLAENLTAFVIYRIIGGIGIGITSNISPIYIAEVVPAHIRGRYVSLNQLTIVLGILSAQITNWLLAEEIVPGTDILDTWNGQMGWRWMFWAENVPAVLFFVCMFFVPESPKWMVFNHRKEGALKLWKRIGGRTICTGRTAGYPGECFSGQRKGAFPVPIQGENETGDLDRDHSGSFPAMVRNQCDLQLCTGNLYLGRVYDFGHVLQYHRHR